jgi:hypothetical protein
MPRRTSRRPGRPLAISGEREQRLLKAIRDGIPFVHAAIYAGVGQRTLFRTLERGEAADMREREGERLELDDLRCRDFWREVQVARTAVMVRNVGVVEKGAQGGYVRKQKKRRYQDDDGKWITETETDYADVDWRAARWLLEMSFAGVFGPGAQRVELSGPDGSPVQVEHAVEIAALAERLHAIAHRDDELEAGDVVDGEVLS